MVSLLALGLAGLVSASPLAQRSSQMPTALTQGFVLVANVTDPTEDFSPSINHYQLTGVHVGAGIETAVLAVDEGRVLFENGTDTEFGIVSDDSGIFPISLFISPLPPDEPNSDFVDHVGVNVGNAQDGIGIRTPQMVPWPTLYGPDSGTFIVCYEARPSYGRPQYPVRFARVKVINGVTYQKIPDKCAPINLLAQCATLGPVPAGAMYNHDFVKEVGCYPNVASVVW